MTLVGSSHLGAQTTLSDPGWPRQYSNGTALLLVYQPQVDGWNDFKILRGRCAFALKPAPGSEPVYGTFRFEGDTLVDANSRIVLLRNVRAFDMRFPSASEGTSREWSALTRGLLPSNAIVVSLDRILAFVRAGEAPHREAHVLTEPPPIFVSMEPAVLVILDGEPVLLDIKDTGLKRVVNTNWDLFQDRRTNLYYLRHDRLWLKAIDLHGQFAPAAEVPSDLRRLFPNEQQKLSRVAAVPRVFVVNRPAELIVIRGVPELSAIAGTRLSQVANTDSDLFYDFGSRSYYFLASGRWSEPHLCAAHGNTPLRLFSRIL